MGRSKIAAESVMKESKICHACHSEVSRTSLLQPIFSIVSAKSDSSITSIRTRSSSFEKPTHNLLYNFVVAD